MSQNRLNSKFYFGVAIGMVLVCTVTIVVLLVRSEDDSQSDRQESTDVQFDDTTLRAGQLSESELGSLFKSGSNLEHRFLSMGPLVRKLAIADLVDNFNENGLRKIFDLAEDFDSSVLRDELQNVAIRKSVSFHPLRTLTRITTLPDSRHFSLVKAVFQEWSWVDLEGAVAEADRLGEKLKRAAVEGILTARTDLEAEDRLSLARELDNEQSFYELAAFALIGKRIDDPAGMWDQLTQEYGVNPKTLSASQRIALLHVAKSWVLNEGLSAVEAIHSSLPLRENRAWITQQLLATLLSEEPALARDIVEDLREEDRATLLEVVQIWASEDGLAAFNAAQWMDMGADDTRRMQRAAIEGWANSNPHTLMANLKQLPEYLQEFSRNTALLEMRWTSPESVPAFVEDIGNISNKRDREWLLRNLMDSWIHYDPSAAYRWALEYEKIPGRHRYSGAALAAMARNDLEAALSIALEQPLGENGIGAEASVLRSLSTNAALEKLSYARNTATRLRVLKSLGQKMRYFNNYDGIFSLVEDEPIELQFEYFKTLSLEIADWNPKFLIDKFDSLPNDDFKRYSSELLLSLNSVKDPPFLSDEQVEKFESFVKEDEKAE